MGTLSLKIAMTSVLLPITQKKEVAMKENGEYQVVMVEDGCNQTPVETGDVIMQNMRYILPLRNSRLVRRYGTR